MRASGRAGRASAAADAIAAARSPRDQGGLRRPLRVRAAALRRRGVPRRSARAAWAHDYPRADWHFLRILERADVHAAPIVDESNILTLDDPDLSLYPDRLHVRAGLLDAERGRDWRGCATTCRRAASSSSTTSAAHALDNFEAQMRRRDAERALVPLDATPSDLPLVLRNRHARSTQGYYGQADVPRHLRGQRSRRSGCWRSPTTTTTSASSGSSRTPAGCRWTCRTRRTSSA